MNSDDYYRGLLARHGSTFRAYDCGSIVSQQARFRVLASMLTHPHASVLDIGCGVGDFVEWMPTWPNGDLTQHLDCRYHGIDVVPEMIAAAQDKHPQARFSVGELMTHTLSAEYVVASGLFQFSPLSEALERFQKMWSLCTKGMAVNFLRETTSEVEAKMDPARWTGYALKETPFVVLRADYLPNDFTLFLYREPTR